MRALSIEIPEKKEEEKKEKRKKKKKKKKKEKRRDLKRRKKTEFEITCCGIVCRGEILMEFITRGKIGCDCCQKGENSIVLEHSQEKQR